MSFENLLIYFGHSDEAEEVSEYIERNFKIDCFVSNKIGWEIPHFYLYVDIYYSGKKQQLINGEEVTFSEAKEKALEYENKIKHIRRQVKKYKRMADDKLLLGEKDKADKALKNIEIYEAEVEKIISEYQIYCEAYQIDCNYDL